jgi:hypothetical protein
MGGLVYNTVETSTDTQTKYYVMEHNSNATGGLLRAVYR